MNDFQAFFGQMPLPVLLLSDGVIIRHTEAAARLLGHRFLEKPLSEFLPPHEASLVLENAARGQSLVLYGVPAADAFFDVQSVCFGPMIWVVLYPHQAARELPGALSLSAISSLAREIREPLAPMLSAIALLSGRLEAALDEKSRRYFASLLQNCFRLMRLSGNLAELPQYAAGHTRPYLQERDLVAFASDILEAAAPFTAAAALTARLEAPDAPLRLAFDEQKIERLLFNLLSNALKHTPPGGQITLSVSSDSEFAYLKVSDTGRGIPPEKLLYLFRANASHRPGGGTFGMGLPIVRMITELHGGSVMLASRPDMGTTVTVSLRLKARGDTLLRSRPPVDYAGEFPHVLVELSDAVPGGSAPYMMTK